LTLIWLAAGALPAALLDPGNPALLAPVLPVLPVVALIAARAAIANARRFGSRFQRLAAGGAVAVVAISCGWAVAGIIDWTDSDATYAAFDGGLRDALEQANQLPDGEFPVYIGATPAQAPIVAYLSPSRDSAGSVLAGGRVQRVIDTRSTLVIPEGGSGYLVYPASAALGLEFLALLEDQAPLDTGRTPSGAIAWQLWLLGAPARANLPATVPTLGFPNGFTLVGFDIRPDIGDLATTGRLPDPPRVSVTLVWSVPRGATPHIASVRLLPSDPSVTDPEASAETRDALLTASPPIAAGNRGRELVVVRLIVPVPESPSLIVDVQAGLRRFDGTILPPETAGANAAGDYALLNRVQYIPDRDAP
jgi:hypothetical protein